MVENSCFQLNALTVLWGSYEPEFYSKEQRDWTKSTKIFNCSFCVYTFIYNYLFIYKIPVINAVTKYLHAPFWYPDQPQHCLQNTDSKAVTLKGILTLFFSIHRSIAPVNWYEFLQTMAFKTNLDSANSYDLLSVGWRCQSSRSKLLWKRFVWVVCLLFASVAGVNSNKFQERIYRRAMRSR